MAGFWDSVTAAARYIGIGRETAPPGGLVKASSQSGALALHGGAGVDVPDARWGDPIGIFADPFALAEQHGYRERQSGLSIMSLEAMFYRLAPASAIVLTRIDQAVQHLYQPVQTKHEIGFRLTMRNESEKPTPADKKYMRAMEQILLTTGVTDDPRKRMSLAQFGQVLFRDSLIFDAGPVQFCADDRQRPAAFYAMDARTIRLADTRSLRPQEELDAPFAVQLFDGVPIAEFSRRQMCFGVRRPNSDIKMQGYGTPELGLAIQIVTDLLNAISFNGRSFTQGSVQNGLLNLKGIVPPKKLQAFRRAWYTMVAGINNAHRTPIINASEGVDWVPMTPSNKDMEYAAFVDFLLRMLCALFVIDPIEVHFRFNSGAGGRAQMFASGDRTKINESKSRGLKPLLLWFANIINQWFVWPNNPNYSFECVGLDTMTAKERADLVTQQVRSIYRVNDLRRAEDMDDDPDGNIILDSNYILARRDRIMMESGLVAPGGGPVPAGSPVAGGGGESGNEPKRDTAEKALLPASERAFDIIGLERISKSDLASWLVESDDEASALEDENETLRDELAKVGRQEVDL